MDTAVKSFTVGTLTVRTRAAPGTAAWRWRHALTLVALGWPLLCAADLTGTWSCNDGGTYYLRQVGDKLFWYGERSDANPAWANVLAGTVQGQGIQGHWVDVPKGQASGKGDMQLRIGDGENTLEATQKTGGFGGSRWTRAGRTEATTSLPYGPDTCRQGYVWREAFPGDHVCVTPEIRAQAAEDNRQASARRAPGGGPYGPDTCRQGYVWREARPDDHVCVTPETRAQTAADNRQAAGRRASQ